MASVRFSHRARSCSWRSMGPNSRPPTSWLARPPAPLRGMFFRWGSLMLKLLRSVQSLMMPPRAGPRLDARGPADLYDNLL